MIESPCIFCDREAKGCTGEHLFPESLGGVDSLMLPDGTVCSACNQYFGQKVERVAIHDFPFSVYRLFLGLVTKKKKPAAVETLTGRLEASALPGTVCLPVGAVPVLDEEGRMKVQMHGTTMFPTQMCQCLLKIGLELLAVQAPEMIRHPKFAKARHFSRFPHTGDTWWAVVKCDATELARHGRLPRNAPESLDECCIHLDNSQIAMVAVTSLPGIKLFVPLEDTVPDFQLAEPEYQLILAKV